MDGASADDKGGRIILLDMLVDSEGSNIVDMVIFWFE